jgi:hypothetical protein
MYSTVHTGKSVLTKHYVVATEKTAKKLVNGIYVVYM